MVATVTAEGYRRVPDDELRKAAERLVAAHARRGLTGERSFYVPPEQLTKEKAEFARKGIGRAGP